MGTTTKLLIVVLLLQTLTIAVVFNQRNDLHRQLCDMKDDVDDIAATVGARGKYYGLGGTDDGCP